MSRKSKNSKNKNSKFKPTNDLATNFLEAGAYLAEIKEQSPGFLPFAARDLGVSLRKVYYLIRIHEKFDHLDVDPDRLLAIGWAKLASVADHIDKVNCKEVLKLAEQYTVHQLRELMEGVVPVPGTRCVILYFQPKVYQTFERVLVQNGAVQSGRGLIGKEAALILALTKKLV